MLLRVLNLATGNQRYYDQSLGPHGALAAAYAQTEKQDWDEREYELKYFHLIHSCGELYYLAEWVCIARQL